jgi:hypothetical protein
MSTVLTLKKLASRVLPPKSDAAQAARAAVREAMAAKQGAEAARAAAEERWLRAESAGDAVTTAATLAREARDAHVAFVRAFMERGEDMPPGCDDALLEAVMVATRNQSQAELHAKAAEAALPALLARLEQTEHDIRAAGAQIDAAIGQVLVETLRSRTAEAHALVERLNGHIAEIVAVTDLLRRRGFYGSAVIATVPDELRPEVVMKFSDETIIRNVHPWKDFAQRLRDDPEAQF